MLAMGSYNDHIRIIMRYDDQISPLLAALKRHLRADGWTARRVAGHFAVGEATAKRWLAGKALTLDRLIALAGLCGLSLAELSREAEQPPAGLAHELLLAQERALMDDEFLALLFVTILSGYPPGETATDFDLPPRRVEAALHRLERLALIDRLPGGRVRSRVDRTIVWRKPPMRALFEQRMKAQFAAIDYSAPDAVYASELVKLSAQGAAMLAELIETYRREVQLLAAHDREATHLPADWYATLCVVRPLDASGLDRLRSPV